MEDTPEHDSPYYDDRSEHSENAPATSSYVPNDAYVSKMPNRPLSPPSRPNEYPVLFEQYTAPEKSQLPTFLQQIDIKQFLRRPDNPRTWQYQQRYGAQQVLQYLYLGQWGVVKDAAFMKSAGITMILAIPRGESAEDEPVEYADTTSEQDKRKQPPSYLVKAKNDFGVSLKILNVSRNQNLTSKRFRGTTKVINEHLNSMNGGTNPPAEAGDIKGTVLVCSEAGNTRAAALVVAYIMETFGASLRFAHRLCQDTRFSVNFDFVLAELIKSYDQMLRAGWPLSNQLVDGDKALPFRDDIKRRRAADVEDEEHNEEESLYGREFIPFNG